MTGLKYLLYTLLFTFSVQSFGAEIPTSAKTFHLNPQSNVSVEIPLGWETAEGLFGIPLTLLGPEMSGTRPTIAIQPTEKSGGLDPNEMKAEQAGYQAGRETWVKKQDGKIQKFIPYTFEKTKNAELHRMGVQYQIAGLRFTEWSVHLFCNQKLYFVKALFESKHPIADQKAAELAIRSFNCN